MSPLLFLDEATYSGKFVAPEVSMPPEASCLKVTYTTPDWPMLSDADAECTDTLGWRFVMTFDHGETWGMFWADSPLRRAVPKTPHQQRLMLEWHDQVRDGDQFRKVPHPVGPGVALRLEFRPGRPVTTAIRIEAG